jgi:hypothetical protein
MDYTERELVTSRQERLLVRAENGRSRDDAWVRIALLPLSARLYEAGKLAAVGIAGGLLFVFVPLVHLLGLLFALACIAWAVLRLRSREVVAAAGGVCPACGASTTFFTGFGRQRYRLPLASSCSACAVALTLMGPMAG